MQTSTIRTRFFQRSVLRYLSQHVRFLCIAGAAGLLAGLEQTPARAEAAEYIQLFDGQSLANWEGDAPYWSVRDGAILGQITPETRIDKNRFLVYQGDVPADFEFIAEFRVSADGNSGVNYRSEVVDGIDFHALRGYQCDIDGRNRYTGSNYEERRRTTLASIGESVVVPNVDGADTLAHVAQNRWTASVAQGGLKSPADLRANVKQGTWNEVRVVAVGNRLRHYINGELTSEVVDNDLANRRRDGKLGIQVHVGPPMTIEYRNLRLRALSDVAEE
ncbi:MAG: DUF1080 domain-containing protein [Planctomycetales bacterium]|nr:DUF1080 domain-containing protein [Planctomycetales bacterium]